LHDTTDPVALRDPQRIAGRAFAKYGMPLSHQIGTELVSLADKVTFGPAARTRIPEVCRHAARRGLQLAREELAQVRARMECPEPNPALPRELPPDWPHPLRKEDAE
jgi:hypothetical protein